MQAVYLKKGKEISLMRKHPWVFSGAILKTEGEVEEGSIARVLSSDGKFLGIGHFQNSSISVRIFSFENIEIDRQFWINRIRSAFSYRRELNIFNSNTNCFRLAFGESDHLPGLVLDYYNGNIVFQAHSIGMHKIRETITEALLNLEETEIKTVYDKSRESLPGNYANSISNSFLYGTNDSTIVTENGNKFYVDWVNGQKTGFFIDQRENRKLLSGYMKDKTLLNTFCYTGGFSVYAGNASAKMIHSVDSSKRAIEITDKNISENNIGINQSFCTDVFDFIKDNKLDYDVIILDPPAFAKHRDAKHKAVIGYKNLNASVFKKAKPGTVIFTFSCTQVVDKNLFFNTVTAAAIESKREIRILHYLNQPSDHPINPLHPESEYLKGLVIKIIR